VQLTPLARRGTGDVRDGASWTLLQRLKNDALWVLATVALAATRPLPASPMRALGRALGRLAHALAGGARRTALGNVARVYPTLAAPERRALVRRCFATLGEALGETAMLLRASGGPAPLALTNESLASLAAARASGRGVLFASAHLGPWERVAASLVAARVPLVTVARESYDPRFSRLYERLRGRHGVHVVWRSSPGAAARMLRTLRGGGVLGVPMDLRSRVPSSPVPFLGHEAPTAIGPARIALRTRSEVVVGTAAPAPGGSLAVTVTRIPTDDLASGQRPRTRDDYDAGARELTARINAELSRRILALPHAWVWMHDRWRTEQEYDGS
jgi:KDO2-lipid IV(A) lauroyltransferase